MAKFVAILFIYCLAASTETAEAALARHEDDYAKTPKKPVQDGILLDAERSDVKEAEADSPFEIIKYDPSEVPSLVQSDHIVCEDVTPDRTGFDVHDENGFMKHASCQDLAQYCNNETIGESIKVSCPASCLVCEPGEPGGKEPSGPCFDATNTGIRFRDGPKADCADLVNYCGHSSVSTQVMAACKLSCGLCGVDVEGPYLDSSGNCIDMQTSEVPQFTLHGTLAGCSDMAQFCSNHPDSRLIKHKCPRTCGVCGNWDETTTTLKPSQDIMAGTEGGCDRRRRWGFCTTRRRRNV